MVRLIGAVALCVGVVGGSGAAAQEQARPRVLYHAVYMTVRIVPAPVACTTDSDCERKHGGPVVLNSRPVYRT